MNGAIPVLAMLIATMLLDAGVRPRAPRLRSRWGLSLHALVMLAVFGVCLAASGNPLVAAVLTTALMALFALASNAKNRMLGEPLVFSDLALVAAIVRHPRFYFTAIPIRQRIAMAAGAAVLFGLLASQVSIRLDAHLAGIGVLSIASGVLFLLAPGRRLKDVARLPDLHGDVARHGLVATLLLYWWRWRDTADPAPRPALTPASDRIGSPRPEIVIVIQCESFADPVEITGLAGDALPALARARAAAWQWGELDVSGFGAYTMRTEYGVLFGRSEAALGFRRYDPFLTALGETSYALPARLRGAGYRSCFVHPHDLRFYARDRLMPAIGFDAMIGEDAFDGARPDGGRYVDDRTLGAALLDLASKATAPTLLYAVTMENHGPWDGADAQDGRGRLDAYLRHARNSDAMLDDLVKGLTDDGRPALLVFFGDHRPSIPGVTAPGGARHTPYVMLRFDAGGSIAHGGGGPVARTPAALHHAILRCLQPAEPDAPRPGRT